MASVIPENRARFSAGELRQATSGEFSSPELSELWVEGIVTDSRRDATGKLFVALVGERFDGHEFAAKALAEGARLVLANKNARLPNNAPALLVDNTGEALLNLGAWHRQRWGGKVLAVAGSAGKTTTRHAIARLLSSVSAPGAVLSPAGNLNNQIGVPLCLLGLEERHKFCVVELGTNSPGEIEKLARVADPNLGVLTLIDLEHTEGLGDLDGVEAEEGALFAHLGSGSIAIGNADDPRVTRQLERASAVCWTYGSGATAEYRAAAWGMKNAHQSRCKVIRSERALGGELEFISGLFGRAGALAQAAAICAVEQLLDCRLTSAQVEAAFSRTEGETGRLRPLELADGTLIIDDSYNANPASVRSSLEFAEEAAKARGARLLLAIGEMRELGAHSDREHEELGFRVAASTADYLVAVGGKSQHLVRAAKQTGLEAVFATDSEVAAQALLGRLRPGDVVLIKASRGIGAERIVEHLVTAKGRTTT